MQKKLLLILGMSLLLGASLSACEVPNTPENNDGETPAASASPASTGTSAGADASVTAGQPTQTQYVAAMKCAATAESNRTLSNQFQQQADIVVNWPADMWNGVGLMQGSAQLMMYGRAEALGCT